MSSDGVDPASSQASARTRCVRCAACGAASYEHASTSRRYFPPSRGQESVAPTTRRRQSTPAHDASLHSLSARSMAPGVQPREPGVQTTGPSAERTRACPRNGPVALGAPSVNQTRRPRLARLIDSHPSQPIKIDGADDLRFPSLTISFVAARSISESSTFRTQDSKSLNRESYPHDGIEN